MSVVNVPVEMISKCSTLGEMIPIKFRMESTSHEIITAKVDEIVYKKESNFAGVKTFEYGCKINLEGKEQLLELSYQVASHKWVIKKIVCGC